MDKYLQLLLQQENTVIIPDLGALMITNEATHELMFNEYLKFNDGKLHKFISENSNMDEQEATNFVAKYVREIKTELDKGETYDMFEFGRLKKKEGKIEFDNWNKYNVTGAVDLKKSTQLDSATEKVETKEPLKKAATKKVEAEKKVEKKPTLKKDTKVKANKKVEKTVEEKKNDIQNTYVPPTATSNLEEIDNKIEEKTTSIKEVSKAEDVVKPIAKEVKGAAAVQTGGTAKSKVDVNKKVKAKAKPKKEKKEKKRKGVGFWVLLAVLLLLGAAGTYYGMNYKMLNEKFGFSKPTKELVAENTVSDTDELNLDDDVNQLNDSSSSDDLEVDENGNPIENIEGQDGVIDESAEGLIEETIAEVTEPIQEEVEKATETVSYGNSSGSYHVIVGGFSEQSNAEKLAAELKTKGYGASVVGQFDALHMVSAQSFNSRDEAKAAISGIRSGVTESAWIFKYPK